MMRKVFMRYGQITGTWWLGLLLACTSTSQMNTKQANAMEEFPLGTYGYDVDFFKNSNIETLELTQSGSGARVLLVPAYQGRVMTSSARGNPGVSFGWINYDLIRTGTANRQFNPFGGEERLWLGPEGGPYSIYFEPGEEQVFENWNVPPALDTEPFNVLSVSEDEARFQKEFELKNASGTELKVRIDRTVKLLSMEDTENALNLSPDPSLELVAYESKNSLTNRGELAWTGDSGFLSIWLLSMFNPSEKGVVFIPFKKGDDSRLGKVVSDDYFGNVPAERLMVKDGIIYFKVDGKYRSKIGLSPQRSLPWCGSYDPATNALTLLWYSKPEEGAPYVNSKWGPQDNPLDGDVVNSYNDGPVKDGSVMGPFYELESSSPAALLDPGETATHTQRIFHIVGDEPKLSKITEQLFSLQIEEIKKAFEN